MGPVDILINLQMARGQQVGENVPSTGPKNGASAKTLVANALSFL